MMKKTLPLSEKKCIPSQGNTPALHQKEIDALLSELQHNWTLNEAGHLYKKYKFSNFMTAMEFANKIAKLSEEKNHHPDLLISWGQCNVEIWTHKIQGLTENDFILASKIEQLQHDN